MSFIDLDYCDSLDYLKEVIKNYNICFEVILAKYSYNGGWPIIRFAGPEEELEKFIKTEYDPDNNCEINAELDFKVIE